MAFNDGVLIYILILLRWLEEEFKNNGNKNVYHIFQAYFLGPFPCIDLIISPSMTQQL